MRRKGKKIPKELLRSKTISDLKDGESVYIVTWALSMHKGRAYISKNYDLLHDDKFGTATLRVTKTPQGLVAEINNTKTKTTFTPTFGDMDKYLPIVAFNLEDIKPKWPTSILGLSGKKILEIEKTLERLRSVRLYSTSTEAYLFCMAIHAEYTTGQLNWGTGVPIICKDIEGSISKATSYRQSKLCFDSKGARDHFFKHHISLIKQCAGHLWGEH